MSDLLELARGDVPSGQHAQTCTVVGLVNQGVADIHVVVDGGDFRHEGADELRRRQVGHVPNEGRGVHPQLLLVQLVVADEIMLVFRQPPLVGVGRPVVPAGADEGGVHGVGHVHDGHRVFVAAERDFLALVIRVRPDVIHHLGVVGVAVA